MGFKTGVLIGVLATAVVALGVAVALLLSDSNPSTEAASVETETVEAASCRFAALGGLAEIELGSEGIDCGEAREVYDEYRRSDLNRIGEATSVAGWNCEELPNAEYPLLARCRQGGVRFAVVGLAPNAHPGMEAPPPRPAPADSGPVYFQTPSGNISCAMNPDGLRCDIIERDWSAPPKPPSCNLDWGHAVELERSGPTFTCAGDTVSDPDNPILEYGKAVAAGAFLCESQRQKLVCVHTGSGHGFWLSIQEAKLF